jgi:hypothetical protein
MGSRRPQQVDHKGRLADEAELVAGNDGGPMIPPPAHRVMSERAGSTCDRGGRQPRHLRLAAGRGGRAHRTGCVRGSVTPTGRRAAPIPSLRRATTTPRTPRRSGGAHIAGYGRDVSGFSVDAMCAPPPNRIAPERAICVRPPDAWCHDGRVTTTVSERERHFFDTRWIGLSQLRVSVSTYWARMDPVRRSPRSIRPLRGSRRCFRGSDVDRRSHVP